MISLCGGFIPLPSSFGTRVLDPSPCALPLAFFSFWSEVVPCGLISYNIERDQTDPLHLHPNESPVLQLVTAQLEGRSNYHPWARAMEMALRSKNKMVLVDGTMVVPSRADPKYFYWDQCNTMTPQEVSPTNLVLPSKGMNCLDTNEHLPEVFEPADDLIQPQVTFVKRAGAAGDDGDGIAFGSSEGGASLEIEIFRDRVGEE
nr:uncharacterized protein LOC109171934 [Ipomoea batatas]